MHCDGFLDWLVDTLGIIVLFYIKFMTFCSEITSPLA
jgi:hypothetical protein